MKILKLIVGISLFAVLLFAYPSKISPGNKISYLSNDMDGKLDLIPKSKYNINQNPGEFICDPKMLIEWPDVDPKIALAWPDIDPGIAISPPGDKDK